MSAEDVLALDAVLGLLDSESSDSEGSDGDSEDECCADLHVTLLILAKLVREERHRVPLYVEEVVPKYLEFEFKKLFRLSQSTAAALAAEFERSEFYPPGNRGRKKITAEKTMLIALTYIGTQSAMYAIADKFDVAESTVHSAINRVLAFLFSISAREIRWPDADERGRTKRAFESLSRRGGLPDVIGAIDGCHIRIARPSESEESYYNRKKFHSIILQGICDADMVFIDVFAGFPGSAHDARVLRESFFFENAASKCEGGYLLGDSAYPLLPWLLAPYKQGTGRWQPHMQAFNSAHNRQRVVIEGAFGLLKARFQRLLHIDVLTVPQAVDTVLGACVLHNIARRASDPLNEDEDLSDSGTDVSSPEPLQGHDTSGPAAALRDTIAKSL